MTVLPVKPNERRRHSARKLETTNHPFVQYSQPQPQPRSRSQSHDLPSRTNTTKKSNQQIDSHTLHVYTYGYCINDGKRGSRAGYGIHVHGHVPITDVRGNLNKLTLIRTKQTRKVASLLAVEKVVEAASMTTPPRLAFQRTLRDAFRSPETSIVIHVDLPDTVAACTTGGERLEKLGFPARSNIQYLKRVYGSVKPFVVSGRIRVVLSEHSTDRRDHEGSMCARQLAKNAVVNAVQNTEKELFVVNSGCTFDDERRIMLRVPVHEYAYARSKGAWWDMEEQSFFVYNDIERPSYHDVGGYYDMRPTDYINLRQMFE